MRPRSSTEAKHLRVYETERQRDRTATRRMWSSGVGVVVVFVVMWAGVLLFGLGSTWKWLMTALILVLAAMQGWYLAVILREDRYRGRH